MKTWMEQERDWHARQLVWWISEARQLDAPEWSEDAAVYHASQVAHWDRIHRETLDKHVSK